MAIRRKRTRFPRKIEIPQVDFGSKDAANKFGEWAEDVTAALNSDVRRLVNVAVVGGGSGAAGDNVYVNSDDVTNPNFNDATPAPPTTWQGFTFSDLYINANWQHDSADPDNVSAYWPRRPDLLYPGTMLGNWFDASAVSTTSSVHPFGSGYNSSGTRGDTYILPVSAWLRNINGVAPEVHADSNTFTFRVYREAEGTDVALSVYPNAPAGEHTGNSEATLLEKGEGWSIGVKQTGAGGSGIYNLTWEAATLDGSSIIGNGANGDTLLTGVTEYWQLGTDGQASSINEDDADIKIPFACTAQNLFVRTGGTQGAGGSLVFTVRKNGADTALTLTVAAGATLGMYSDITNTVSFAAGDRINVKVVNNHTSTSTAIRAITLTLLQTGLSADFSNFKQILVSGGDANVEVAVPLRYRSMHAFGTEGKAANDVRRVQTLLTRNGVFRNMYLRAGRDAGGGLSAVEVTLYVNDAPTALQITVAADLTTQWLSNTSDEVTVSAGDLVHWDITATGTGAEDNRIDQCCVEFALS